MLMLAWIVVDLLLLGVSSAGVVTSSPGAAKTSVPDSDPDFLAPVQNITAALGRPASLTCTVTDLGSYKVGWMNAEDGTILTVHTMVVTHNPRVSVFHDNVRTWELRLRAVRESDRGCYMCQINTSPMKKQLGCIDVHVPPDISDESSSGDVTVEEGSDLGLNCTASGRPTPRIVWRREDGDHILSRNRTAVEVVSGESLPLPEIGRRQTGAYLCIASNDVPPAVSKRIMVSVNFAPSVAASQRLVGVPTFADARLECLVESHPPPTLVWIKNREETLLGGNKYDIFSEPTPNSAYQTRTILTVRNFTKGDLGTYMCVATNPLGRADGNIRLYEIRVTTPAATVPTTTTTAATTTTTTKMTSTTTSTSGDFEYVEIQRFAVPPPPAERKVTDELPRTFATGSPPERSAVSGLRPSVSLLLRLLLLSLVR